MFHVATPSDTVGTHDTIQGHQCVSFGDQWPDYWGPLRGDEGDQAGSSIPTSMNSELGPDDGWFFWNHHHHHHHQAQPTVGGCRRRRWRRAEGAEGLWLASSFKQATINPSTPQSPTMKFERMVQPQISVPNYALDCP